MTVMVSVLAGIDSALHDLQCSLCRVPYSLSTSKPDSKTSQVHAQVRAASEPMWHTCRPHTEAGAYRKTSCSGHLVLLKVVSVSHHQHVALIIHLRQLASSDQPLGSGPSLLFHVTCKHSRLCRLRFCSYDIRCQGKSPSTGQTRRRQGLVTAAQPHQMLSLETRNASGPPYAKFLRRRHYICRLGHSRKLHHIKHCTKTANMTRPFSLQVPDSTNQYDHHHTLTAYGPGLCWPDSKAAITCISMKRPCTNAPVNMLMCGQPDTQPVVPAT